MAQGGIFSRTVRRFYRDYVADFGTRTPFGRLIQRATRDPEERQKLLQAPKKALAEAGVQLPDGLDVEALENTDKVLHLVLPPLVECERAEGGGP